MNALKECPDISKLNDGKDEVADGKTMKAMKPESNSDDNRDSFEFGESLTLENIRELQAEFAKERNWDQFHSPRNLLLAMVGEVGELAEIFQWRGEVAEGLTDWTEKDKKHVGQELSDVLIYLIRLAEKCHIDLSKEVVEKINLNKLKYPANKVWGCSKKYNEYKNKSK